MPMLCNDCITWHLFEFYLQSIRVLGDASASFKKNSITGIKANHERISKLLHEVNLNSSFFFFFLFCVVRKSLLKFLEVTDEITSYSLIELHGLAVPDACNMFEPCKLMLLVTWYSPLSFCNPRFFLY